MLSQNVEIANSFSDQNEQLPRRGEQLILGQMKFASFSVTVAGWLAGAVAGGEQGHGGASFGWSHHHKLGWLVAPASSVWLVCGSGGAGLCLQVLYSARRKVRERRVEKVQKREIMSLAVCQSAAV